MSAYAYKNLLIIDRGCTNDTIKRLIALKNWGLPPPKLFEYRSPEDKSILCYSAAIVKGEDPTLLASGGSASGVGLPPTSGEQEGAIHLLGDGANIKVSGCMFSNASQAPKHLASLKSYLEYSVSKAAVGTVITLYWSPHLVNDSTRSILVQSGLLTELSTLSHQIKRTPQPSFGFGVQSSSSTSGFRTPSAFGSTLNSAFGGTFGSGSAFDSKGSFWK